jgi:pimeloyl-ACP methyl ester carboxylesterase
VEEVTVTTTDKYILKMIHLTPQVDNGSTPILL